MAALSRAGLDRARQGLRCPYCREPAARAGATLAPAAVEPAAPGQRAVDVAIALAYTLAASLLLLRLFGPVAAGLALALPAALAAGCLAWSAGCALVTGARRLARGRAPQGEDAPRVLRCARSGCGALYHPECWEECRRSYGACAVFGCGATLAEPLGGVALLSRVLREAGASEQGPRRAPRASYLERWRARGRGE